MNPQLFLIFLQPAQQLPSISHFQFFPSGLSALLLQQKFCLYASTQSNCTAASGPNPAPPAAPCKQTADCTPPKLCSHQNQHQAFSSKSILHQFQLVPQTLLFAAFPWPVQLPDHSSSLLLFYIGTYFTTFYCLYRFSSLSKFLQSIDIPKLQALPAKVDTAHLQNSNIQARSCILPSSQNPSYRSMPYSSFLRFYCPPFQIPSCHNWQSCYNHCSKLFSQSQCASALSFLSPRRPSSAPSQYGQFPDASAPCNSLQSVPSGSLTIASREFLYQSGSWLPQIHLLQNKLPLKK